MSEYKQRYCKNCGAPLEHGYNHHCEYCGTLYDFNVPENNTIKIHSFDLVNVEFIGCEIEPCTRNLLLKFRGVKFKEPNLYEYDGDHFISQSIDVFEYPVVAGFIMSLEIDILEQHGISYLRFMLHNHIRPTEIKNIEGQMGKIVMEISRYCHIDRRC